ncbi:hypothetical protein [Chitinophaga sp. CF418]|uniref:hypothetical protein n=1 Tax=Chitinophaga sp. CF418 TaxID=1855287 RepID=UPI000918930B|nr:hypothetical protein [Chitinophaga sp. CF418]SHN45784.1 hypothetical protein SAMN05216311_12185 [Chitinophaga sp. CF418]
MWIEIKKDIFENLSDFKSLNFLLQLLTWTPDGSVQRYQVLIDFDKVGQFDSYKQISPFDKELIAAEFDNFVMTGGKTRYYVTNDNKTPNTFNLEESIRFFIQPASIILENSKNDALFIEAIIHHFDGKIENGRQLLKEYINNGWIQFENAGGCGNVKNFIEGKLQSFNNLAQRNNRPNHHYLRCIVVLDSDKHYPGQPQKHEYDALEKYLQGISVTNYHILEKRAMENYIPDDVIIKELNGKANQSWINVYKYLTVDQKDFLSYNTDFSRGEDGKIFLPPLIAAVYVLSQANLEILHKGIEYPRFKDEFPKLFNNALVNKKTLRDRAGSNELEIILDKIKSLT